MFEAKPSRTSVIIFLHNIWGPRPHRAHHFTILGIWPLSSWPKIVPSIFKAADGERDDKEWANGAGHLSPKEGSKGLLCALEFIFYWQEVSPLATLNATEAGKLIFIMGSNMIS